MKRWWFAILALAVGAVLYYTQESETPLPQTSVPSSTPEATSPQSQTPLADSVSTPTQQAPQVDTISPAPAKRGQRAFYGELPEGVKRVEDLVMTNSPSPNWGARLIQNLQRTGGTQLKEATYVPQESYIIMDGAEGRYVERVVVTVKAHDGRRTSFFAEVDSETGHVTKSWGAIINENRHDH